MEAVPVESDACCWHERSCVYEMTFYVGRHNILFMKNDSVFLVLNRTPSIYLTQQMKFHSGGNKKKSYDCSVCKSSVSQMTQCDCFEQGFWAIFWEWWIQSRRARGWINVVMVFWIEPWCTCMMPWLGGPPPWELSAMRYWLSCFFVYVRLIFVHLIYEMV